MTSAIFMSYDSAKLGPVNGEATTPGSISKDPASGAWMELMSCSFSGQPYSERRQATNVAINTIRITKETDGASSGMLQDFLFSAPDGTAAIIFMRTDEGQPQEYLRLELKQVGVVSYDMTSGTDRPIETITLYVGDFTIVTWTFDNQTRGGQSVTNILNRA